MLTHADWTQVIQALAAGRSITVPSADKGPGLVVVWKGVTSAAVPVNPAP